MKKAEYLFIFVIFLISVYLRFSFQDHPFWVDEFSSAEQAKVLKKYGITVFNQEDAYFESHNFTNHLAILVSFSLFGESEVAARLPSMLFGSLVPILVYFLAKKLGKDEVAIPASLLTTFSYFEISWSRQARGYMIQQNILLLTFIIYFELLNTSHKVRYFTLLLVFCILGLMTHPTFLLVILSLIIDSALRYKTRITRRITTLILVALLFVVLVTEFFTSGVSNIMIALVAQLKSGLVNNLWYYHSFLWRQQTVVALLSIFGITALLLSNKKREFFYPLIIATGLYLFFFSFLFGPYVSRYLLSLFPFLLIFAAYGIYSFSKNIARQFRLALIASLTLLIIANGHNFAYKTKAFFSINHSMREVALIDYDQMYDLIVTKGKLLEGHTAVIDTWPDRMKWYLGDNQEYMYIFRWENESGLINGLPKFTPFVLDADGTKRISSTGVPNLKLITSRDDLIKVTELYQRGFIWIDDASLPRDVIEYVETYFQKELYLDHYEFDDNPYSLWPGTLYSWGFDDT